MTPGPWLLLTATALAAGIVLGPARPRLWLGLTLGASASALVAALLPLCGAPAWAWRSTFTIGGEPLSLQLDALSAFFLTLVAVIAGLGAAYAHGYWPDRDHPHSAPRGRRWWSAIILSLVAVLVSANGLHFLLAWELFTLAAYYLLTLDRQRHEVRAAGWLYLGASHVGTLALFAFFAGLAAKTGSWSLGPMHAQTQLAPLFWFALVGFGLKAGMFPLHVWLPSAHANAPSHVSALMSGVTLKLGLYGLLRFSGWLPVPAAAPWVVIGLGAATAVLGIAFALAQSDLKRLLAYCSVENVGIILTGFGAALLAATHGDAPWGRLALAGALLHVWNHGLFKALLFLGAGSVLHATGTREMSRLGGLWRVMPWTAGLFTLGAVAIAGLPPLNGFVSEWLVYLGLFEAVTAHGAAAWAALPAAIALGIAGALALASFMKAGAIIFLGAPRTKPAARAHESGRWMLAPMVVLAGLCLGLALTPALLWPALARAIGLWHPAWAGTAAPASLGMIGPVNLVLAGLLAAAAAGLAARAAANGRRRALTWDCGYAAPTARMQYTGGSFGGLGAGWFAWILRPDRQLRRPRGFFPGEARLLERTPETVLEHVLTPAARAVLVVSTAVRRLQHGRLQFYILYLLAGLIALGIVALVGGSP